MSGLCDTTVLTMVLIRRCRHLAAARLCRELRDHGAALLHAEKALDIDEFSIGKDHPLFWRTADMVASFRGSAVRS